jgi:hypothetical protein
MSKYGCVDVPKVHTRSVSARAVIPWSRKEARRKITAVRVESRRVYAAAIPNDPIAGTSKVENEMKRKRNNTWRNYPWTDQGICVSLYALLNLALALSASLLHYPVETESSLAIWQMACDTAYRLPHNLIKSTCLMYFLTHIFHLELRLNSTRRPEDQIISLSLVLYNTATYKLL